MRILHEPITRLTLKELAQNTFGDMIKCVADVKRDLLAIDADLHADLERLLLEEGSDQKDPQVREAIESIVDKLITQ